MNTVLISLLQMVLSLLFTVQGNPSISAAERQQALSLAGESIRLARQTIEPVGQIPGSGGSYMPPQSNPPSAPNPQTNGSATPSASPSPTTKTLKISDSQRTVWQTCGSCGNSAGNKALASYQMKTGVTSPSLSGSAAEFSINGNGQPYANAYWWAKHQSPGAPVKYLKYSFDLFVPSSANGVVQAIEFEGQQGIGKKIYNFAWQANYAGNQWRTFDYEAKRWVATSVPFTKFKPDTWHHIETTYHIDSFGIGFHDSINIDGQEYADLNIKYAPSVGGSDYLNNAFQLDTNSKGAAYKVYLDNVSLEYGT